MERRTKKTRERETKEKKSVEGNIERLFWEKEQEN